MSNSQQKKLRQLVRRQENKIAEKIHPSLVSLSWDCFFETISQFKLRYRIKLAWKIILGKNIRKEEQFKNGKRS